MSRSASYTLAADLPPWAPLLLLAATFVLETWDLWREWSTQDPITAGECWEFCAWSGATASAWGPERCECAQPAEEEP